MKENLIVLSDFDNTITNAGVMTFLYERFATCGTYYEKLWEQGLITTQEGERKTFECIHASREEMMEYIYPKVWIDPGLKSAISWCKAREIPFAVVSEGQTWYIRDLLARDNVEVDALYAAELIFKTDGSFELKFPYYDSRYPRKGTAKAVIIENYRAQGYKVVFIGDGYSDTDAVKAADVVFAKEFLLDYCQKEGVPCFAYKNFNEVTETLKQIFPN